MSRLLAIGLCILQIAILVQCNGLYTIVAPGTLRSKSDYHVSVSVHDAPSACKIKVGLSGPEFDKSETVEVPPKSSKVIMFQVPKLKDGDYNLTAEGLSGIEFKNTTKLNFAAEQVSIYVQTDKATYKPGDKVQYRVLVLDKNTRPAKIDGPVKISINDGARNLIKQLNDVELTKGVYSGELQLSEFPVLGSWNIEVSADGTTETKNFEVDKYVLPKFEVMVEAPKDVAIADGKFSVTVRSKYTFGKPVKGSAVVSVKPSYYSYGDNNEQPTAEKTVKIDGKGRVEFDISKDLKLDKERYTPPLTILAIVEEELTGLKQNSTGTVNLHREKYQIEGIDTPYTYYPGKPVTIKLVVKNLDGSPVQDTKNPVTLTVSPPDYWYRHPIPIEMVAASSSSDGETPTTTIPPPPKSQNYTAILDKNGMAEIEISLPDDKSSTYYSVKANYLDSNSYITSLSKFEKVDTPIDESLKLTVQTKNPALGKDVSIKVQNGKPIPYFVYTIVGRGDIVQSELIEVPENRNYHVFKITPTFQMIPQAKIFIHYVTGTDFNYAEETINFAKDFQNSISIEAPIETKPGADVEIKVNTDPNSYVGLLGVDQSVLLLKSGNDLKKDQIFQDMSRFDSSTPWSFGYGQYPGTQAGVVTMTNANHVFHQRQLFRISLRGRVNMRQRINVPFSMDNDDVPPTIRPLSTKMRTKTSSGTKLLKSRKLFSENWIFDKFKNTDGNGITLSKKVPDTITSWVLTGFSLNPETGLAITDEATKMKVFQPFFISTNLPYSVKRGEVIAIPVVIFNYLDKNLDAEITMDNSDHEYSFAEATNEVTESASDDVKRTKTLSVPSNSGQSVSFMIRTNKVGPLSLKISAISPIAGDAIQQTLKVEPEGVTKYVNKAVFMNLGDEKEKSAKVDVDIPENAVEDSEYVELSVVGDLLGPTIKNLDKLIRMPYGCGEQNMVNFVPNILVLKYLTATKQLTPAVEEKAKKFLEIGYQRELQYKHDDGSYSAFGKSDKSGSTWLTAYVVKSFHQAIPFTDIDPKIIEAGLKFLADNQLPSGEFPEVGKVIDSSHSGGSIGLSAYVLLAFLENVESADQYKDVIEKGSSFLEKELASSDDQYSLSIAAQAFLLGKRPESAKKVLAKLDSLAKNDGDRKWWSKTVVSDKSWYGPRSVDAEMTSYVLLAKLKEGNAEEVLPIVRWLISQRNSNGGFASTQDTVIGLEALTKFAEKSGSGTGKMTIAYDAGEKNTGEIAVNPENSLILQTHVLPKTVKEVALNAKGTGSCLAQVSYRYNIADKDNQPRFGVMPVVKSSENDQMVLVVCTDFKPLDGEKESNMAVMEVSLPSGYTANTDSFDKIKEVEGVKRVDSKNSDSALDIYFDKVTPEQTCVSIDAIKSHAVAKQKPAPVSVYDYYDNNKRNTEYYEVASSLCDICQGDDCGAGCAKKN
ncbi:CD109 antigen isoform X8 [Episyrphus balteatus]|uniref:CD109 antigen isoform X8 n=1 Tax=Episyrphus balteatus TaxID=286459 RepID=UPI0024858983|nr:CD109 antigen isoform X8 [Episyrphus balteatus]